MSATLVFAWWPYVAMALFLAGLIARYMFTSDAAMPDKGELIIGDRWWRLSLLSLLAGHLAGLLFPQQILFWNLVPARLYVLEGVAFVVGAATLAGWAALMWRHLGRSGGTLAGQLADAAFLSLSFVALLSGLLTAVFYRWGSSWGVSTLTPYAWSVLRGNPVAAIAAELPFVVRVHVFSSLAGLAMIPYTRLAPVLIVPIHKGLGVIVRPVSVLGRSIQSALESAFARYNPLPRIWPEED